MAFPRKIGATSIEIQGCRDPEQRITLVTEDRHATIPRGERSLSVPQGRDPLSLAKTESFYDPSQSALNLKTNLPSPAVSVVVCTRNRVQSFKRSFEALVCSTTAHPWELVIVDNGSTDGTDEYLKSIRARKLNGPSVITTLEPKRGLAAARNRGWRTSTGRIVAFTDDDCYVSKDFVDAILAVFEENSEIGFLGGRILLYDSSDRRLAINDSDNRLYLKPYEFFPAGAVQGANMAFRRSVLERIGGFDERLGAGTPFPSEDTDALAAALWAGIPGVYDPRPLVYHHHQRKTELEATQLLRSYDAGRGAYYAKYIMKNKAARWKYIRAWFGFARNVFIGTIRAGELPKMGWWFREISGALRYAASECLRRTE
jgi:GT2 family glycosyltransferase